MQSLTGAEGRTWLEQNDYRHMGGKIELNGHARRVVDGFLIAVDEPWRLPQLADDLSLLRGFSGQRVVWVSEWNIWSNAEDALRHLSMLTSRPRKRPEQADFHCYLFEQSEWEEIKPILCVALLYGWDAYMLAEGGRVLVEISHESIVSFLTLDESGIDEEYLDYLADRLRR